MRDTREKHIITAVTPCLLLWGFLCLIALIGGATTQSVFYSEQLPSLLKAALYCSEAIVLFGVLIAGWSLGLKISAWLNLSTRIRRFAGFIGLFSLIMCYLVSWLSFHRLGMFLNAITLRMLTHDPVQLFRYVWHVDSKGVFQLFFLSLAATGLIYASLQIASKASFALQRMFFILCSLPGLLSLLLVPVGSAYVFVYGDRPLLSDQSVAYSLQEYYTLSADKKTGPLLTLTKDLLKNIFDADKELVDLSKFSVLRSPVITMEEYLKTVDFRTASKYNVIILLIESMRKDVLPVYHGTRDVMPTVEWIAGQSVVFEHAYSQATHSNYADIPPLSSHYPLRSRQIHFYPENPSYPRVLFYDILKPLGYQTGIFSSQNEEWGGMMNYLSTPNLDTYFYSELSSVEKKAPLGEEGDKYARKMFRGKKDSGELDDRVTIEKTLEWIKARDKKNPFALYLNLQNSHYPYEVPPDFQRRFLQGQTQEIEDRLQAGDIRDLPLSVMYDQYCDSLAYMDEQIQRLITALQEENEWDNTILVVSADTATRFVESPTSKLGIMIGNGASIVEEVVNVPLLIFAPQLSHKIDRRDVQHVDIVPTITALLGLPQHPSFQGLNLFDETYPESRSIYLVAQTPFAHQYALIRDRWQLLYDKEKERYLFIDLTASDEKSVRSNDERLFEDLQARLHAWMSLQIEYYDNPYLHSEFYPPVIMDE